ncbi:MAG TPA: hypothetical protein VN625_08555 [Desulfuromonadaceae bacterium]|nr:hypothetical protein [Desulfuromonadaceae bacterium]
MKQRTVNTVKITSIAAALFSALLLATPARAQIGSGWSQFSLSGDFIDYEVGGVHHQHSISSFTLPSCWYTKGSYWEKFGLSTSDSNRVEHDSNHHFNTGSVQFQGDLVIHTGISQQSVVQDFGGGSGRPICMIKGYGRNNGALVVTRDTSFDLINNLFNGQKVRVNINHDTGAHKITIYINGTQKWSGGDAGTSYTGSYNFKYGLYGSFNAATYTYWENVKFFKK